MIGATHEQTRLYLAAVAAQIEGAVVCAGEAAGLCAWLRIPTVAGFVGVWDAEELGEHGLVVQAYELDDNEEVTHAGDVAWVCERAPVQEAVTVIRRYLDSLDGPAERRSRLEQGQLQTQAQQPDLLSGHGCGLSPG